MRLIDADALKLSMMLIAQGETKKYCYPCREILKEIDNAPTIEQRTDAEFWQKRADEYYKICMDLITEMRKGVKIDSVKIDANGITFMKKQGEV